MAAGDVRGHDLDSWWRNRADYRKNVTRQADLWRQAAAKLSQAAGNVMAFPPAPADLSYEKLVQSGDSAIASMRTARNQLAALDQERQQAEAECEQEQNAIRSASQQRVRAERQAEHERDYQARLRAEQQKEMLRKGGALLIGLLILYVIVRF